MAHFLSLGFSLACLPVLSAHECRWLSKQHGRLSDQVSQTLDLTDAVPPGLMGSPPHWSPSRYRLSPPPSFLPVSTMALPLLNLLCLHYLESSPSGLTTVAKTTFFTLYTLSLYCKVSFKSFFLPLIPCCPIFTPIIGILRTFFPLPWELLSLRRPFVHCSASGLIVRRTWCKSSSRLDLFLTN